MQQYTSQLNDFSAYPTDVCVRQIKCICIMFESVDVNKQPHGWRQQASDLDSLPCQSLVHCANWAICPEPDTGATKEAWQRQDDQINIRHMFRLLTTSSLTPTLCLLCFYSILFFCSLLSLPFLWHPLLHSTHHTGPHHLFPFSWHQHKTLHRGIRTSVPVLAALASLTRMHLFSGSSLPKGDESGLKKQLFREWSKEWEAPLIATSLFAPLHPPPKPLWWHWMGCKPRQ